MIYSAKSTACKITSFIITFTHSTNINYAYRVSQWDKNKTSLAKDVSHKVRSCNTFILKETNSNILIDLRTPNAKLIPTYSIGACWDNLMIRKWNIKCFVHTSRSCLAFGTRWQQFNDIWNILKNCLGWGEKLDTQIDLNYRVERNA